jgi:hypothetical protein
MSPEHMPKEMKHQARRQLAAHERLVAAEQDPALYQASQMVSSLQNLVGNRAVNRLIESRAALRQVEEPSAEETTGEESFDTSDLGREERLPGHGNTGGAHPSGVPQVQRVDGGGAVTANMNLTTNAPVERSRPAADIAAAHGRPGVAGWTTPAYDIRVPRASPTRVDINVTMDYDMELATEFTGDTLRVLRDHEVGHVNIGNQTAQEHLITNLETRLESQDRLTPANIQGAINTAGTNFERTEGQESQTYDTVDYPRMQQAYLGARLPLADLEAASGNIATLATAVRSFNTSALAASETRVGDLAQAVLDARDALSEDELSRLQYNAEFKTLLTTCGSRIDEIIEQYHWDLWIIEFSTLDQQVRNKLDELRAVLGDFNWVTPV